MTEQNEKPTALNIRVSLKGLTAAKHLESSPAFVEATKILTAAIGNLNSVVEKVYGNSAVVAVVTVTEHHQIRAKRQTSPEGGAVSFGSKLFFKQNLTIFWFTGQQPLQSC